MTGWINCIGVFQEYYQTHELRDYSPQAVAWIPSIEAFVMFIGGVWVGRVFDNYGPRHLMLAGTVFHVFGLMMGMFPCLLEPRSLPPPPSLFSVVPRRLLNPPSSHLSLPPAQ